MLDAMPKDLSGAEDAPPELRRLFLRKETFKSDKEELTDEIKSIEDKISISRSRILQTKEMINDYKTYIRKHFIKGNPTRVSRLEKELQKTRQELADFNYSVAVESVEPYESDEDSYNVFGIRSTGYRNRDFYGPLD